MSLGAPPTQRRKRKLFNIDGLDTSGNQQAVAGTYFGGTKKISLTWLSPIYNLTSKNINSSNSGKAGGKAGGSSTQKQYYGDFAAWCCYCPDDAPTDALLYVLVDGNIAFTGPLGRNPTAFYSAFTLDTYCQEARWYYGRKDQPIDDLVLTPRGPFPDPRFPDIQSRVQSTWPTNEQLARGYGPDDSTTDPPGDPNPVSGHYDFHPGYKNQCIFVFKQFLLGTSGVRPTIQVIISRGCKFINGGRFESVEQGVPPMPPIYEILGDDMIGPGWTDAKLDAVSLTATQVATNANLIAPFWDQASTYRSWLADYFQYYDGWVRRKGATIEFGYWPHGYIPPTTLPQIASDDLTGEPQVKPGTDRDTKNDFTITFTNRTTWYTDDSSLGYVAQANLLRTKRIRRETLNRPFVLDPTLAQSHVNEYGAIFSELSSSGTITVKRESADAFQQGDFFNLESASNMLAFVFKVLKKDRVSDRDGTVKLTIENHRANWPIPYTQPPAPKDPDFEVEADEITQLLIRELPSGLKGPGMGIQVGVLARRPGPDIIGFNLFYSSGNVSYDKIESFGHFAVYGQVAVEYPSTTSKIDWTVGIQITLYGLDQTEVVSQTGSQMANNNLLLFVEDEILSISTVVPIAGFPGRVRCYCTRALYGTLQGDHEVGLDCWFIYRNQLDPIAHNQFLPGTTRYFKVQGYTTGPVFPIEDCAVVPHVFSGGPVSPITNLNLDPEYTANGDGTLNSQITATWDYPPDQDIASFNASIKRSTDENWQTTNIGADPIAIFYNLVPGVVYSVRIQAVSADGDPSAWSPEKNATAASSGALPLVTFINDYGGAALTNFSYSEIIALSVRAQVAAGLGVRVSTTGPVTVNSPIWPAYTGGGDGRGTNMLGYVQSTGTGPDQHFTGGPTVGPYKFTTIWRVRAFDPANPTILGPESSITTTYITVDKSGWPTLPKPDTYTRTGDLPRGNDPAGVRASDQDAAATLYHSPSGDVGTFVPYTADTLINVGLGQNQYFQAKRYIAPLWEHYLDSPVALFANTDSGVPAAPGGGDPGSHGTKNLP